VSSCGDGEMRVVARYLTTGERLSSGETSK